MISTMSEHIPQADAAESAVIGSMILDEAARDDALALVSEADFFEPRCALLFRCLADLHLAGKRVDPVLAYEWLRSRNLLDQAGGAAFIAETFRAVPTASHLTYYAKQVANASTLRSVLTASSDMGRDAAENQHDPEGVLQRAEKRLADLCDRSARSEPAMIGELLDKAMRAIDDDLEGRTEPASVSLGIGAADSGLCGGMRRKQLVILAARPGVGKTALATQIATHAAMAGKAVLFISLEMSSEELSERILTQESLIDGNRIRDRTMSAEERSRLVRVAAEIGGMPLFVDDCASLTMRQVTAMARRKKRRGTLDLIIVDYLQLMSPIDARVPREQQVSALSRAFKLLAKDLDVPVLCLCQMNRDVEKQNREPRPSDLRESGALEQDADVVMFLHRDPQASSDSSGAVETHLIIAKQRNGPQGRVSLMWHKKHCRFAEKAAEKYREFDGWNGSSGDAFE